MRRTREDEAEDIHARPCQASIAELLDEMGSVGAAVQGAEGGLLGEYDGSSRGSAIYPGSVHSEPEDLAASQVSVALTKQASDAV